MSSKAIPLLICATLFLAGCNVSTGLQLGSVGLKVGSSSGVSVEFVADNTHRITVKGQVGQSRAQVEAAWDKAVVELCGKSDAWQKHEISKSDGIYVAAGEVRCS